MNSLNTCLICDNNIDPFMSFGNMPISNAFIKNIDIDNEFLYEMSVAVCDNCNMFQLLDQPDPDQMFNDNYAFFSGTSVYMKKHFKIFPMHIIY